VFELTRRVATRAKNFSREYTAPDGSHKSIQNHLPRIVSAVTLVTGGAVAGLAYELSCRPWDNARKAVHVDYVTTTTERHSVASILLAKIKRDGWTSVFKAPGGHVHEVDTSKMRRRVHTVLRTLARVGPWGVGFLAWEAFGPGLS
jgi:hypothetical protein